MEYSEEVEVEQGESASDGQDVQIQDTDIVFDCPHCGHNLCIDYRALRRQRETEMPEILILLLPFASNIFSTTVTSTYF